MSDLAYQPLPRERARRPGAVKPSPRLYTYADYKRWDDEPRRELLDGRVYMMSAPSAGHQEILGELFRQFANHIREGEKDAKRCRVYPAPYDVRLSSSPEADGEDDRDVVQPDITIVCDSRKRAAEGCRGAPDLVVEVLSPATAAYDLGPKLKKYLRAGVREYWTIDPDAQTLTARRLTLQPDGKSPCYRAQVYQAGGKARPGIFPGCEIDLGEVFSTQGQ